MKAHRRVIRYFHRIGYTIGSGTSGFNTITALLNISNNDPHKRPRLFALRFIPLREWIKRPRNAYESYDRHVKGLKENDRYRRISGD